MRFLNVADALEDLKRNCKRNVGQYSPRVVLEVIEHYEQQVKVLEEEKALLLQQIEHEVDSLQEDQAV
ncbi:hypothetical protein ACFPES_03030 [Paenibacillus sp. GCM10023248]|uniref:hypothetical protein n=1 Tax=unclassified Paenibacillus TaxID=185978 RepID=UPI002379C637|nr:hypothetical protein [Paenibacillus sp. MAHUQ-63]MDD9265999.1 hypothetical protein [Paenibacillus sp. MAHUQ-63]